MPRIAGSFFLIGLLFGSGPCLASCGPLLLAYVAGTRKDCRQGVVSYAIFSLARILVYVLLGLGVFFFSRVVIEQVLARFASQIFIAAGGLMALLGLFIAARGNAGLACRQPLSALISGQKGKGIFILGLIIGLLPCAPLLAVLSYVGMAAESWSFSLIYALSFGIGTFLSPLILAVVIAGLIPHFLSARRPLYYSLLNWLCAATLVILGIRLIIRAF